MPRVLKLVVAMALIAGLAGVLAFGATRAEAAKLAGNPITYNLFATDTFIKLADGTMQYVYGFVGGRSGQPIVFQNSQKAALNPGGITELATTWPAPSTGPIPPPVAGVPSIEAQLAGNAQFPAPLIYAAVGDVVEIRLKNLGVTWKGAPNDPHSIHLHGLDVDAANDGVPETSLGAVPANLAVPGAGNVVVYMFSPTHAGTYMYHCHQEADIHVQMGMYGALVVYEPTDEAYLGGGPGKGLGGTLWGWKYDKDYILLLSEFDTRQHLSEQMGWAGAKGYNPVNYMPQYWMINGLSFPNTIHVAGLAGTYTTFGLWEKAHPGYDPLITGSVSALSAAGTPGEKVLIRVINMGFETQPMHMHGFHGKIIGSDQRAWPWANTAGVTPFGQGLEKNTLTIGSGETYEWLIDFGQQSVLSTYANGNGVNTPPAPLNGSFPGGTQSKYGPNGTLPTSNTDAAGLAIPDPLLPAAPYIAGPQVKGLVVDPPTAATADGVLGGLLTTSQFFPFHNHDDYKATNNGVYPGGQFTMIVPEP